MKLIVGLGNPGEKYVNTRHNTGFDVIDEIAKDEKFSQWRLEKKFKAQISQGSIIDEKAILAKPETFMNNSGEAVSLIANFYKISPHDIFVIHDDLDLPCATIRISQSASSGGHNGVQSIIDYLKTQEFIRFRLGIAGENKTKIPSEEYVLQKFGSEEKRNIESATKLIIEAIEQAISLGAVEAMNEFN